MSPEHMSVVLSDLTVGEVMTREILALAPDTSLPTAARLFATRHITGAPVIDVSGRVLGVVSQTDLVDPDGARSEGAGHSIYYRIADGHTVAEGEALVDAEGVVSDVMSPSVLAIGPDAPILEAVRAMVAEGVHRLLVADDGKLVGIVTSMDVLRALLGPAAHDGVDREQDEPTLVSRRD
jgi:CBS domain-containing membrane protein